MQLFAGYNGQRREQRHSSCSYLACFGSVSNSQLIQGQASTLNLAFQPWRPGQRKRLRPTPSLIVLKSSFIATSSGTLNVTPFLARPCQPRAERVSASEHEPSSILIDTSTVSARSWCYEMRVVQAFSLMIFCLCSSSTPTLVHRSLYNQLIIPTYRRNLPIHPGLAHYPRQDPRPSVRLGGTQHRAPLVRTVARLA